MATKRWRGGAAATTQVNSFTMAGTWEVGDLIRFTSGQKVWDYAVTSTVIATFLPLLVTAFNALDAELYPEFTGVTAGGTSPAFTLTADEEGVPFLISLTPLESNGAAADAQTIEGAGTVTTGTVVTASAGPNHWDTPANWHGLAVPVSTDDVYLEESDDDISYGLAQSGVTLASLNILASFTGTLGLPEENDNGYPEPLTRYLAIGATACTIGEGAGSGSGRIKIDFGSVQTTCVVRTTASASDQDAKAARLKGTHASNVFSFLGGSAELAPLGTETTTASQVRIDGADVRLGAGCTLTTCYQLGGTVLCHAGMTTLNKEAGEWTQTGTGTITTVHNNLGTFVHLATGTITTYNGRPGSTYDRSADNRAATIGTINLYAGSAFFDPGKSLTISTGIILFCRLAEVQIDLGYGRTLTVV